jgi:uncharacterized protein (DUF885 family)
MPSRLWISLPLLALAAAANAQNRELHALFDAAWEQDLKEDPLQALYYGDSRYVREWPEESPAARQRREAADAAHLASLKRIDRANLSPQDRLSYDLFAWEYQDRLDAVPFKTWLYDLRSGEGVQTLSEQAELLPFETTADYENWIARLQKIDRYLEQYTQMLEFGIREKRTQPKVIMERVTPALAAYVTKTAEENAFYAPFKRMPSPFQPPIARACRPAASRLSRLS